jgi:hypothetical protein
MTTSRSDACLLKFDSAALSIKNPRVLGAGDFLLCASVERWGAFDPLPPVNRLRNLVGNVIGMAGAPQMAPAEEKRWENPFS